MGEQKQHFDILIVLGLPASGKSEVLKVLRETEALHRSYWHLGDTLEVDDFPLVAASFDLDDAHQAQGLERLLTTERKNEDGDFIRPNMWETLAQHLRNRYEQALQANPSLHETTSVLLECSRGGSAESSFPLEHGYQATLGVLGEEILRRAAILYISVSPEEAWKKNEARFDPSDPSGILTHMVPRKVMKRWYAKDDAGWLAAQSAHKGYVSVLGVDVPFGQFDNEKDLTSFVRQKGISKEEYDRKKVNLREALHESLHQLYQRYTQRRF